jgi:hypothetical protein
MESELTPEQLADAIDDAAHDPPGMALLDYRSPPPARVADLDPLRRVRRTLLAVAALMLTVGPVLLAQRNDAGAGFMVMGGGLAGAFLPLEFWRRRPPRTWPPPRPVVYFWTSIGIFMLRWVGIVAAIALSFLLASAIHAYTG